MSLMEAHKVKCMHAGVGWNGEPLDTDCVIPEQHRTGFMVDKHEEVEEDGDEGDDDEEDDCKSTVKSFPKFHFAGICFQ